MNLKHWNPRKKQPVMIITPMKIIRIDARTQIEVPVSISDAEAIDNYHLKHDLMPRSPMMRFHTKPEAIVDTPEEAIEESEVIVEEEVLPSEE
jgi:hypothetical protein